MSQLRSKIAHLFRALPRFRGKARLGAAIGRMLPAGSGPAGCVETVTMRDGTKMRLDVRSRTERWAYWTGDYDRQIVARLASCLQPGWTVFDIGANVGFYAIALGSKMKAMGGTVHAFEPVKSNCDHMSDSIALSGLESTVFAHNVALGDDEGSITLHMEDDNDAGTGSAVLLMAGTADGAMSANVTARLTRLDTFAAEQKIDSCHLIKIDVEGAEAMCFRGGLAFLARHRPIIYGEFNPFWMEKFGHSFLDIAAIVGPWNYRFFLETAPGRFTEVSEIKAGIADILMCPSETPPTVLAGLGVAAH